MTAVGAVRRPEAWALRRDPVLPTVPDSVGARLRAQFPARPVPECWPETELSRGDLLGRLLDSPYRGAHRGMRGYRRRGLLGLVDWLEAQPGSTWQQRWIASGVEDVPPGRWHHLPVSWWAGKGSIMHRADLSCGMQVLLAGGAVRPGYRWMLGRQNGRLAELMAQARDPDGFAHLHAVLQDRPDLAATNRHGTLGRIVAIMVVKGGMVPDITVGDCRELWQIRGPRHVSLAKHHFYDLLRAAGMFPPNAPEYLRMFLPQGQLGIEEMIDRYGIAYRPMRDLLVDYLRERQPTLDYATLCTVASTLGRMFWRDLELHHPGIDSLRLPPGAVEAWRQRIAVKTRVHVTDSGDVVAERSPRAGAKEKFHLVRAFYLDIAHWAVEDPRWAAWTAPCPIRPRDVDQSKDKKHRKSRMDQRTRERLPVLPALARTVAHHRNAAAELLDAGRAAAPGTCFTAAGTTLRRSVVTTGYADKIWAEDPAGGKRRDLTQQEHQAFWTWAIVEVLRHTGIRAEELLELSHHSFVQYRLPTTGELVPLLQIAPSKTDTERLLLISPELADVLAAVVHRVRGPHGAVPAVASYDRGERIWNPPMPLLFQRRYSNEIRPLTRNYVRDLLNAAITHTGLTDVCGTPLRFTPHDFRRLFITDAILGGLPPHIAQIICGHADINTTLGYKAVYPAEAITAHRSFIARRRRTRPSEEYRTITDAEWDAFLAHFEKRKVSLGTCGRAFGTPCTHEHACIRCPMLRPDPAQRPRLIQIRDNLNARIAEAQHEGWLGEAEGLQVSLAAAEDKLTHLDDLTNRHPTIHLGMPDLTHLVGRTSNQTPTPRH